MEPDFDARLREHLHRIAHEVPNDATVIPALRQRLIPIITQRRFAMPHQQRRIMPKIGIIMAVLLVLTFALLHTFGPSGQRSTLGSGLASATSTPILTPTATSIPVRVTAAGITIVFEGIDVNPVRTAVRYTIVTQPTKSHEDYSAGDMRLSDSQRSYQLVAGSGQSDSSNPQLSFMEMDFVPIAATHTGPVTMTFRILTINDVFSGNGTPFPHNQKKIAGLWTYTTTVTPRQSGMQTFTSSGVTSHGVSIQPTAADWISGEDHFSQTGLHIQVAVTGLPIDLAGATFFVPTKYVGATGGNGSQIDAPPVITLTTSTHQTFIIPAIFKDTLNEDNTIGESGKAFFEIVFQNVVVTHGEDIQLRIENLSTCSAGDCSTGSHPIPGTWSLTLHF